MSVVEAGGEPDFVRESIRGWLVAHATDPSACFVCEAWLQATGEVTSCAMRSGAWLAEHGGGGARGDVRSTGRGFQAGGDPELLREPIRDWLAANATKRSASFVLQKWLENGGDPAPSAIACGAGCAFTARARRPVCAPRVGQGGRLREPSQASRTIEGRRDGCKHDMTATNKHED